MRTRISLLRVQDNKILLNKGKNMAVQITVSLLVPSIADMYKQTLEEYPGFQEGATLRHIGNLLDKHFIFAASLVDRLKNDGWQIKLFCHVAFAQNADIRTIEDASFRLKAIGVDPQKVHILETWDDWFPPANNVSGAELMSALGF